MVDANSNVTANNGVIISGPTAGEGIETGYEVATLNDCIAQPDVNNVKTIENKLITAGIGIHQFPQNKNSQYTIKFKNCIFTDAGNIVGDIDVRCKLVVEDCKFINIASENWGIIAYADLEVNNCEFINLTDRGGIQMQSQVDANVVISNCTFNGIITHTDGYGFIRFVTKENKNVNVNISNNNFESLGQGDCIIAFRNDCLHSEEAAERIAFSNNTVNSNIKTSDYVYNDMADNIYYNKFVAGIK